MCFAFPGLAQRVPRDTFKPWQHIGASYTHSGGLHRALKWSFQFRALFSGCLEHTSSLCERTYATECLAYLLQRSGRAQHWLCHKASLVLLVGPSRLVVMALHRRFRRPNTPAFSCSLYCSVVVYPCRGLWMRISIVRSRCEVSQAPAASLGQNWLKAGAREIRELLRCSSSSSKRSSI